MPYVTAIFEPHDPFVNYNGNNLDLFVNLIYILRPSADVIYRVFEEGYAPVLKSWSIRNKAEEDADKERLKAQQTWAAWLTSKKPKPLPGPFIEWKFPLNMVSLLPSLFIPLIRMPI